MAHSVTTSEAKRKSLDELVGHECAVQGGAGYWAAESRGINR